jgi:hypothetical protein
MKLLFALCLLAFPAAAKKDLVWTPAVIESSFRTSSDGHILNNRPSTLADTSVRESIYIDAGDWLYHVTQTVHAKGTLNFRDGTHVEVAVEGKHLYIRTAKSTNSPSTRNPAAGKARRRTSKSGDSPWQMVGVYFVARGEPIVS